MFWREITVRRRDNLIPQDDFNTAHEVERSSERTEKDVTENGLKPRPASSRDVTSSLNE